MKQQNNPIKSILKSISNYLVGDKIIWIITLLLSVASIIIVGSVGYNVSKHISFLGVGLIIAFIASNFDYRYWGGIARIGFAIIIPILAYTIFKGQTISGANASRWVQVPVVGLSFQPSAIAVILLLMYLSRNLYKYRNITLNLKQHLLLIIGPIVLTCGLVFPGNFSTAAIIFSLSMMIITIGGYPLKFSGLILLLGLAGALSFYGIHKMNPELKFFNRAETWESRIERFMASDEELKEKDIDTYQIDRAKAAIFRGGFFGVGSGKAALKNWLPQSNSDFIYAMIIEEYGIIGGLLIMVLYLLLLIRVLIIASNFEDIRGTLLVLSVGFPIVIQAFVNMAVAVGFFPVTGQTLPLISEGGTSMVITFGAIGIILSLSNGLDKERQKRKQLEDLENEKSQLKDEMQLLNEEIAQVKNG